MKTILVVDDTEDIRDLVCTWLRRAGYGVVEAENGEVALELMARMTEPPCLVLLDLMMPVMSGSDVLAKLRASAKFAALPVVVTSAIADRCKPEGARAY